VNIRASVAGHQPRFLEGTEQPFHGDLRPRQAWCGVYSMII
jgi:hypothetical protein